MSNFDRICDFINSQLLSMDLGKVQLVVNELKDSSLNEISDEYYELYSLLATKVVEPWEIEEVDFNLDDPQLSNLTESSSIFESYSKYGILNCVDELVIQFIKLIDREGY